MNVVEIVAALIELVWVLLKCVYISIWATYYTFVPAPRKNVKDKVVLITGAARGVGRHLALRFAALGSNVVLLDVAEKENAAVAEEIRAKGGRAWSFCCDVSSRQAVFELRQRVLDQVGPVHVLINNAAIVNCQPIMDLNGDQIQRTFNVNILAHFWLIQAFLGDMLRHGEGHICAISSIAGFIGTSYLTDYCASKFAVRGLMHALEEELHQQGQLDAVKLTTVCPVAINTGMFKEPQTRFELVAPILKAEDVAESAIDAILTERTEVVVPHRIFFMHRLMLYAVNFISGRSNEVNSTFYGMPGSSSQLEQQVGLTTMVAASAKNI